MGKLYIVPTPVGNLGDMTFRAVEVLKSVDRILAEDTRTSGILLKHFDIHTPMISHHKYNEHESLWRVIDMLKAGETLALISDAGTPGISDPGFMLSRECRLEGIEVECLPGPTAFVPALLDSGLPCDRFHFEGFLPPKKGRATRLEYLSGLEETSVIYESPKRLARTLRQLAEYYGEDRKAAVVREISKIHETTHSGTLLELQNHFELNQAKGEIVIVIEGRKEEKRKKRRSEKNDTSAEELIITD